MTDKLDRLISALREKDSAIDPVGLEARVWQRLDAAQPRQNMLLFMRALRALPVVAALVMGSAAGAGAVAASQHELGAFAAVPAYSVAQLVQ